MPQPSIDAAGYRVWYMGGHIWQVANPDGDRYSVDMGVPECDCKSRAHPYCKHIIFLAGICNVMADQPKPGSLGTINRRLEHYE